MALQKKSLGVVESTIARVKSIESTHNKVVEFVDPGGADVTLPIGTPVSYNEDSGAWQAWSPTAAATSNDGWAGVIRGFVYPDPVVMDKDGTSLGVVMFSGRILYDDIDITQCAGGTENTLKAALQGDWANVHANVVTYAATGNAPTLRALGITVEGVIDVR